MERGEEEGRVSRQTAEAGRARGGVEFEGGRTAGSATAATSIPASASAPAFFGRGLRRAVRGERVSLNRSLLKLITTARLAAKGEGEKGVEEGREGRAEEEGRVSPKTATAVGESDGREEGKGEEMAGGARGGKHWEGGRAADFETASAVPAPVSASSLIGGGSRREEGSREAADLSF